MLVSQTIDDVSGGVSQQPQGMRASNQVQEQINAISYFGRATMRRAPLRHVAKLTSSFAGSVKVFFHEILRSTTARFHLIVAQGDLQVFDSFTGLQQPVYFPNGKGYLNDTGAGFRAVTFGDTTMLVNRGVITRRGTAIAPVPLESALLSVVQGDYSTSYTATIGGIVTTVTTPDNTGDTIRSDISTTAIAGLFMAAFAANDLFTINYSFVQFGSVIQITHIRSIGDTFTMSTEDGLSNQGLLAILGKVQRATDLPDIAPNGYIVEVVGEPSLQVASQFVQYDASTNPTGKGVWVEVIKPGALTGFDASTLPHRLQQNGDFLNNATARALPTFPSRVSNATVYSGAWEFPVGAMWPGGMVITFSFYRGSGTGTTDTFTYTVLEGDETSEAIIVKLRTLINLDANYTASGASTHQLSVVTSSTTHGGLETTPTTGLTFPTAAVWPSALREPLIPNALAGLVLTNVTDGSSAVIVTNSSTSILTAGLSRGGRNTFSPGDVLAVRAVGNYFIFSEAPWADREAGCPDKDSVPYPSFVDTTITNLFVYSGRLGLLAAETVVFSRAGDIFNVFRRTVTDVLDDDPIDVNDVLHASSGFHSAVIWDGALYLWCDIRQYLVSGFTPSSITFSAVTEYPNLPTLQPVTAGSRVFFMGLKNGQPRLMDYRLVFYVSRPNGESVSDHIPSYLQGTPVRLVADDGLGLVALLTVSGLYIYNYNYTSNEQQRLQEAWGKWTMPANANVLDIGISDGELSVITQHSDGLYLNSLGLDLLGSALLAGDPAFVPGPLASVTVAPNPITLNPSTVQTFVAVGQDANGNNVPITPVWSTTTGGTIDSATGVFTAGGSDTTCTVTATVGAITGTAAVTIATVAIASITVTPDFASVVGGDPQTYTAVAKDALGNVVSFTPVWSVFAGGGTIDSATGVFTAGGTAGLFNNTIRATSGAVLGNATVSVIAGPVASITITPASVSLAAGATEAFTAVAKDASGIVVASTFTWSVVAGGGSIDSTGLWTSGATLGTYTNTVKCTVGAISANATVTITVGVLTTITITPNPQTIGAGHTGTFTATGYDAAGGIVSITPVWSVVAGGGTINSSTGVFTAGGTTGTYTGTVEATAGGVTGTATAVVGSGSGVLTSITVTPSASSGQSGDVVTLTIAGFDAFGGSVSISSPTVLGHGSDTVSGDDVTITSHSLGFYSTYFQVSSPDGLGNTIWGSASFTIERAE